jgi:hypothetical protein
MTATAKDRSERRIQQICFFLPNRLGTLRQVVSKLEESAVRLAAISVQDAADYAVVRIVANDPQGAATILADEGVGHTRTEILAVALPKDRSVGVGGLLAHLYRAEVNVEYVYSLHQHVDGRAVLALHVDAPGMAARVLTGQGFDLVGQDDLSW